MKLVLDTNIIISALIKDSTIRKIIFDKNFDFITPAYTITEINKYKDYLCEKISINSEEFDEMFKKLFNCITIINPKLYSDYLKEADLLIDDKKDVAFIALALAFNCPIWSDDKHFQKQNRIKIITTKEMLDNN